MTSRRTVLRGTLATFGALAGGGILLPRLALAQGSGGDSHDTAGGNTLSIHPVAHASFVLQTPGGVIYNDPVGGADAYGDLPPPDLILITHEHGDHYDVPTLEGLVGDDTPLVVNPAVLAMLPAALKERATAIGNGDATEALGMAISAVPAYNLSEGRLEFHPKGRDNGYVLDIDGTRVYIAGDTEAVPEMRALRDIGIAFVPMNLPYTMAIEQAADGVVEFAPKVVYPYHYKGSDPEAFAALVRDGNDAISVMQGPWYG